MDQHRHAFWTFGPNSDLSRPTMCSSCSTPTHTAPPLPPTIMSSPPPLPSILDILVYPTALRLQHLPDGPALPLLLYSRPCNKPLPSSCSYSSSPCQTPLPCSSSLMRSSLLRSSPFLISVSFSTIS